MPRAASKESCCATPISPARSRAQTPAHDITGTPGRALPGHDPLPGIGQRDLVDPDKASTEPLGSRRGSSPRPVWDVEPEGQGFAVCVVPAPITPIRRFEVVRRTPSSIASMPCPLPAGDDLEAAHQPRQPLPRDTCENLDLVAAAAWAGGFCKCPGLAGSS
ncbi:hypothetical protein ColLi_13721 [Colletotrichum liriopes]|uniref:Uncharacterized protein n=1 Tax=Colletotrichum liriopes TaxID=708192 RepID=A0AA37M0Y6_9PEZI|nr:hypothetical protein ColLi_13721 [Colletotrichum liriopes]